MKLHNIKVGFFRPKVKGLFSTPIPYEDRIPNGDSSAYFGQWEGQRKEGGDTNCCWAYAGNECLEDQLKFLIESKRLPEADYKWFKDNGYIDSDGDPYLSRRFIPILSGVTNKGNDEQEFWRLTLKHGAIPDTFLPYTNMDEYFDKDKLTKGMYDLGQDFLKHINIAYEELGSRFTVRSPETIKKALRQGELQIGVPIPDPAYNWNQLKLKWDGSKTPAHSVALYKYDDIADPEYPYFIFDQYQPALKQLSKDYLIPLITRAVVTEKKKEVPTVELSVFFQFIKILQDLGIWRLGKVISEKING